MKVDNCWANIDKKEGGLNSKVDIYFDENDTGANRSVKIRVSSRDGSVSEECTLVHKKKEQVVYRNKRQSALFTKEGCNPETEKGEELEYVVEAGKYTSVISQSDADDKAMKDIEQNGQNWVNEHGRCITILWYNVKKSKSFRKNDCDPDTEEGSLVTMTIEAGQFSSIISQEDANRKAEAELNAKGQDYANSHGTCNTIKWYNDRKSKMFQKTDCEVTEVGSMVEYVVEASRFSSSVSKEDANQKALDALEAEGPGYANEHGTCETNLWYNVEKSKVFYKNDCEDGFIGAPYTYTVEAGKYTSDVSQEDADQKALDDIEKNGQDQANLNGECVTDPNYFVGKASARVQKNDCDAESQTGSFVDLTEKDLAGYPDAFVSRESQEAANALAQAAMEEQKQDLANKKGTCIDKNQFVGVYSKVFTKDNCDGEGVGSQVTVDQDDVTGGPFTSTVSQEDANSKAQAAVEAQGQALADAQGTCTWTGKASKVFTRNNCGSCQHGSSVTVTQDEVGGPFTSNISQADANKKAQDAVNSQGQAVANKNADCLPDSTTPSWSDTGSIRCDGCTSQKQQRDTNPCSSSYNNTRWVNGGGEYCTDWSYYGTGDCVGHIQYNAYRDSCSGSVDRQYSVNCRNCCNCGSYGSWQENGCKNDQVKYVRYDDCGHAEYKYEYEVGKCGYAPYEFQFHDGRTSKSRSVSGESQDIEEVIISTKSGSYIGFSVKSKPDWCSVDYRDQTSESMKAVVTLSANTTSSSRSGDIVFVQNESGKTITLSISQARQMLYKFTFYDNTTSDKSLSVQAASNDAQYTIKSTLNGSYHGFATTSKPSWITTEYKNQASDSMVCVLKITANTSTSSSRTGSVVLTQNDSGKTLKINVTQAAAEVKLVPAHITLKNGSWATYKKNNVSYNPGAGKCIAGFEWTGDENGDIRIYTCDIKVVDSSYREIPGATISIGTTTQRKQPGSSCSYFGAVAGGILAGYVHVGDENKDTTWYIRTINVSYDGKLYKSATVRQFEKTGISKNGGIFNVYNESPASYNFIVDGAECGDDRGTLKYFYSQMNLNPV